MRRFGILNILTTKYSNMSIKIIWTTLSDFCSTLPEYHHLNSPNITAMHKTNPAVIQLSLFLVGLSLFFSQPLLAQMRALPKCAYIASYEPSYAWQAELESGLRPLLSPHCQIDTFYMNSKKLLDEVALKQRAEDAHQFIQAFAPDLLIFSDDNAVKEVLMPYYRDSALPAVFCGVNESGKAYGLPYQNTTGMIEKSNFGAVLQTLQKMTSLNHQIVYLSSTGVTEKRNIQFFEEALTKEHLLGYGIETRDEKAWQEAFIKLNQDDKVDLIVLGSYKPFKTWNRDANLAFIAKHQTKPLVAIQPWMLAYANLGITKSAKEQGEWAALTSLEILNGLKPAQIPIVPNHQFDTWVNASTAKQFPNLRIPRNFQPYHSSMP